MSIAAYILILILILVIYCGLATHLGYRPVAFMITPHHLLYGNYQASHAEHLCELGSDRGWMSLPGARL